MIKTTNIMRNFDSVKKKIEQLVTKPNERSHSISTWKWVLKLKPEASVSLQIAALGHDIDRSVEGNPVNFQQSVFKKYSEYKRHHSISSARIMYRLMVESGFDNYTSKKVKNLVEHHECGKRGDVKILTEADSLSFFEHSIPRYMKSHTLRQTRDKIRFMYCRLSSSAKNLIDNMNFKNKRVERIVKGATAMAKYSITLNFLIPKEMVRKLKKVKTSGESVFDWRKSDYCHCTVKAIAFCDEIPDEMRRWVKESERVLSGQSPFRVHVKGVAKFPTAIFANVYSDELIDLHKKLFMVLPSSQPQYENDRYVPHISLMKPRARLLGEVKVVSDPNSDFGEFEVKEIQLIVWDLDNLGKPTVHKRFKLSERK